LRLSGKNILGIRSQFWKKILIGHAAALFTILVWGTTYVSTKVLLVDFAPIDILFLRFLIKSAVKPRPLGLGI